VVEVVAAARRQTRLPDAIPSGLESPTATCRRVERNIHVDECGGSCCFRAGVLPLKAPLRQMSATGIPASACSRNPTACHSLNRRFPCPPFSCMGRRPPGRFGRGAVCGRYRPCFCPSGQVPFDSGATTCGSPACDPGRSRR